MIGGSDGPEPPPMALSAGPSLYGPMPATRDCEDHCHGERAEGVRGEPNLRGRPEPEGRLPGPADGEAGCRPAQRRPIAGGVAPHLVISERIPRPLSGWQEAGRFCPARRVRAVAARPLHVRHHPPSAHRVKLEGMGRSPSRVSPDRACSAGGLAYCAGDDPSAPAAHFFRDLV